MEPGLLRSADAAKDARRVLARSLEPHVGIQPQHTRVDGVRFWRPLANLDVVCGEGTAREVPPHAHEAQQVLLPACRFAVTDAHGRESVVNAGVVHLTSPLELHGARSLDGAPVGKRIMLVATELLRKAAMTTTRTASRLRRMDDAQSPGMQER